MNETGDEQFMDLSEEANKLGKEAALELWQRMLMEQGIDFSAYQIGQLSETFLRDFKKQTNWSIREIAELTGINKDKVHRMVRG